MPVTGLEEPKLVRDVWKVYDKKEVIGEGGFATTVRAIRENDRLECALKIIYKYGKRSDSSELVFERELSVLQSIQHKHIVRLIDALEDKHSYILALELLRGGELFARITKLKHYSEKVAAKLFRQMLQSVKYLHEHGIAHLDIKPENFVFAVEGDDYSIKLIDFGLSQKLDPSRNDYPPVGTARYKSPEMEDIMSVRNADTLMKADAFSLGVVLYTMIVGKFPSFDRLGNLRSSQAVKLSPEAQDMLHLLTERDQRQRLSVRAALKHPWITNEMPDVHLGTELITAMKNVRFMSRFQRVMIRIMHDTLSENDRAELHETFDALDLDGDGTLSVQELVKVFQDHKEDFEVINKKAALAKAASFLDQFQQRDGEDFTQDDFVDVHILSELLKQSKGEISEVKTLFQLIDVDGDGKVTPNELAAFLADFDAPDAVEIFHEADSNGDGVLEFDEFLTAMKGYMTQDRVMSHGASSTMRNLMSFGSKRNLGI